MYEVRLRETTHYLVSFPMAVVSEERSAAAESRSVAAVAA